MALRTSEDVYLDWSGRRKGLLRALTTQADELFAACDPGRENLCLYGAPDGTWSVGPPADEVPPELPEPALGVNFARDGMDRRDWLALLAVHSDAWLAGVAAFNGARLDAEGRRALFNDINSVPTLYEAVSGRAPARGGAPPAAVSRRTHGAAAAAAAAGGRGGAKRARAAAAHKRRASSGDDDDDDDDDEGGDDGDEEAWDPCPNCGRVFVDGEFWIQCDACDRWLDGACVRMTEAAAAAQPRWACPACARAGGGA